MSSDAVDFLMSQKNGAEYVVLYQMLCLMTVKTNGKLERQLNEVIIPYDAEKIQRDTKYFNIDTVRNALQLYTHLGLIYKDENGCLTIADYENIVGSESGSAERVRRFRNLKALHCNNEVTETKQLCNELSNTDIDIDKEIDKEIDKDKDIDRLFIDKNPKDIRSSSNEEKEQLTLDETSGAAGKKRKQFKKPTVEEIEKFAHELNLTNLDPQYFYDYYESNGWMVGKNHMKDWKATAKNWNRRQFSTSRQRGNVIKMPDYMREQVDAKTFGDLEKEGKCPF